MPRLKILRHHRRSASSQGNTSAVPPPSKSPLSIASTSSTNLASPHPPPRTSPPSVPPLDALPPINSGSPGLGSPVQWLAESTAGSSRPDTSNSSHVSEPPTTAKATVSAPLAPLPPPPPRPRSRSSKPLSAKPVPSVKTSTLSQQVKAANAALAAQPPSLVAPVSGSSSHHNPGSNSSSNNAANQSGGGGGHPISTTITSSYRRNAKLTLLNPMSLLMRRRSSQAGGLLSDNAKARNSRDLPDDFDPGIIYGTRHPDWSNPPKRGQSETVRPPVNGRSISPLPPVSPLMDPNNKLLKVEVVADDAGGSVIDERLAELERERTPVFKEHFDEEVGRERGSKDVGRGVGEVGASPAAPPRVAPEPLRVPTTNPPPVNDLDKPGVVDGGILPSSISSTTRISSASSVVSSNEGGFDDGKPRGVTLVDHPLSLPHHLMTNSSRFSFEASSAAESNKDDEPEDPYNGGEDDGQDGDELGLELDFEGDDDDEGFSRANEGLFMLPNDGMYGNEDYLEDEGGVPLALRIDPSHEIGIALSKDSPIDVNTPTALLNLTEMSQVLPAMDPEPAAVQPEQQSLVQRLDNPRGLDLSGDSDFDELEQGNGMAGYEDDDDDLYFDDGFILGDPPIQGSVNNPSREEEVEEPMNKEQRDSFPSTLGVSSGGAMQVEDGSLDSLENDSNDDTAGTGGGSGYGNKSFPPFLNPIGGGLGCTQQQAQFYAPDGTILDGHTGLPLALSTLTQQLYQYQRQQQREAEAAEAGEINSPGAISGIGGGYESDYAADWGSQSGYYSIDDDEYEPEDTDDSMVAEANAEALAYDTEFYGQEFGFYPASSAPGLLPTGDDDENAFAGGYFGRPPEPTSRPIIRRPSLTPISERSEGSYRNSLVFPVSSSRPLSATVPAGEDIGSLISSSNSGGAEITLEQLMRLRRNAWGGSNGSLRSSRGSGAHSPVPANSSLLAQGGISPPPPMPPGLAGGGGVGAPPGLSHPGKNAMLPTKTSFEDAGLPPPSEAAATGSGSGNGRSTADSSYASAVGSPVGDCDAADVGDGNGDVSREGWVFSAIAASSSSR
ncbi:unnamed protein product [Tuber melanosporum]|uniref:(Perigord truffle) hypothetical protein n=1 Tax=Tuber melanosporum (strain Mel28) TaxID=656061 RepID=D5GNS7_TUBMM|nr:uncharacterized protein GSTUM_00011463001 [Tuber melanosporum]CAZ86170.1 unnamed protein product [Tuber melanosporum]